MAHLQLALKLFSVSCSFGAFSLFVHWLMRSASETYGEGLAIRRQLNVSGDLLSPGFPLASRLGIATTTLLPMIDHFDKRKRLQVHVVLGELERKLMRGGLRSRISPEQFMALSVLFGASVGILLVLALLLLGASFMFAVSLGTLLGASAGFVGPTVVLDNLVDERVSLIEKRLPFAIEFVLLSMEARATFATAIEIYCTQMGIDPLASELGVCLRDIRLGMSAQASLSNLARRVESDDVSTFVLAVNSGLDTGQPVKDILQVQADVARQRRYQSAEQIAKTASTRAIFPLFIVAMGVVLLLLGPLFIKLIQHSLF
jgi:pilus assembly protein TadC